MEGFCCECRVAEHRVEGDCEHRVAECRVTVSAEWV